uniref:YceI family protein n=1 Tax=uncultured Allobacillus sp. TaxID=1638025 RepID=UPI002592A58D|nr:YceI family protein [uncultured Allobacillus sp.]
MSNIVLDQPHSSINFQVKHMMVSKAKGEFRDFDIQVDGDINDLENLSIEAVIQTASIDTNQADRDAHLKSEDFFDAEKYPTIKFVSKSMKKVSGDTYELTGDVTMKGVTNEETFTVNFNGQGKEPMQGNTIAGFDFSGTINREAYGLSWNAALETGGVLVGKDVKVNGEIELIIK